MKKIQCLRCSWEWTPRTDKPVKCPRCFGFIQKDKISIRNVKDLKHEKI